MNWLRDILALFWPPVPVHMRKPVIVYDRQELAQRTSDRFDGTLSPDEVLAVWDRHPEFGPGGQFWDDSDLAPRRA